MGVTTNDTRDYSKFSSVVSTGEEASALGKFRFEPAVLFLPECPLENRTDDIYPDQAPPHRLKDEGKTEQLCV